MLKKRTICVIEDDPDICKAVSFRLQKEGYEVTSFMDGSRGLEGILANMPDLLVLDLMLPGLSGEQICKNIREHADEAVQKTPIIMLTAKDSEVDAIIGRVIGANYYMTKPFKMDDLLGQIKKILAV